MEKEYVVLKHTAPTQVKVRAHRIETNGKALRLFDEEGTQIGSFAEGQWVYVLPADQVNESPTRGVL